MPQTILNIAGGKIEPIDVDLEPHFLVNVDKMYYSKTTPEMVEEELKTWMLQGTKTFNVAEDAYQFMERTAIWFDRVCVYRFLEHIPMDKVLYFIYLLSTVTQKGAEIDVIVPNYETLAHMILSEESNIKTSMIDFEAHNIELTTELLNEPYCPHASVWTKWRAHHFFQLEKRFAVTGYDPNFEFDGRDVYLRFIAERL